jgi:predicted O-linked N-acetylglucosamine transferase (SPINDLY family)
MGVPVVTLAGNIHASRVGASLLTRVGLAELATDTQQAYVQKAVTLAGNLPQLAQLRAGLRERMARSPLCDAAAFTRALEQAYREMWRRWSTGAEA